MYITPKARPRSNTNNLWLITDDDLDFESLMRKAKRKAINKRTKGKSERWP